MSAPSRRDAKPGRILSQREVVEDQRAQRLHDVGDRVERRRDLHRPREQVARHEVRRQEQQREEDRLPEFVAAALRVLSAISCMKPVKTTAQSAVSAMSRTKPSGPLAIEMPNGSASSTIAVAIAGP